MRREALFRSSLSPRFALALRLCRLMPLNAAELPTELARKLPKHADRRKPPGEQLVGKGFFIARVTAADPCSRSGRTNG